MVSDGGEAEGGALVAPPPVADAPRVGFWAQPAVRQVGAIFSVGGLIAVVVAMVVSYNGLMDRAAALKTAEAAPVSVRFEWPPLGGPGGAGGSSATERTWVNAEIREAMLTLAYGELTANPLDDQSLERARRALLRTGWFDESVQKLSLTRDAANVVTVRGTWRVPVAVVRFDGADHLVARGGELLPLAYPIDGSGLKVIVGVPPPPSRALPAPGERWDEVTGKGGGGTGGQIQAGLDLLAFLSSNDVVHRQVQAVDVGGFKPADVKVGSGSSELVVITQAGTRIRWGGPVGEKTFNPGQVSDADKLARLVQLHRQYGRIDGPGTTHTEIDIRPAGPVLVRDDSIGVGVGTATEGGETAGGGGR